MPQGQHKTFIYTQTNIHMQTCMQSENHKVASEPRVTKSSEKIMEYRILYRLSTIMWTQTIFRT